jgi:hypothetical protein
LFWDNGPVGSYANWGSGEPKDNYGPGSEQNLGILFGSFTWNDEGNLGYISGYIAEAPVPLPSTIILLTTGLMGLIGLRKRYQKGWN